MNIYTHQMPYAGIGWPPRYIPRPSLVLKPRPIATRDWYAWINLMPPKPDDFHVIGEVLVSNPGVQAQLSVREPQGFNPSILLLDLHLYQQPGIWPQVITWVQARYDKILSPNSTKYTSVEVFFESASIAQVNVDEVH